MFNLWFQPLQYFQCMSHKHGGNYIMPNCPVKLMSSNPNVEAACSFITAVLIYQNTWHHIPIQRCTNHGFHVARMTKFCALAPNICGSSAQYLLHVTILAPKILGWLLDFGEICVYLPPYTIILIFTAEWVLQACYLRSGRGWNVVKILLFCVTVSVNIFYIACNFPMYFHLALRWRYNVTWKHS
jgi:hypothetical protein